MSDRSSCTKKKLTEWKSTHDALKDKLAEDKDVNDGLLEDVARLTEEVEEWKQTADDLREEYNQMRGDYGETIHSLTPEPIQKSWVKNMDVKGKSFIMASIYIQVCVHVNI